MCRHCLCPFSKAFVIINCGNPDGDTLQLLFEAGGSGLLPKDLAAKLERFKVTRHQVSRRILRMNKRVEKEFGEHVAEKRGWRIGL